MGQEQETTASTPDTGANGASDDRASILAGLASLEDDSPNPTPEPEADNETPPEDEEGEDDTEDEDEDDTDEEDDDEEDEDLDEDDEEEDEFGEEVEDESAGDEGEDDEDPELEKRLSKIKRAEARSREKVDAYRREAEAEIQAKVAALQPRLQALEAFEQAQQRVQFDPVSVFLSLGMREEDLEPAARQFYAHSPAAQKNPETREQARAMQRQRQALSELEQTKEYVKRLEQRLDERDKAASSQKEVTAYIDSIVSATRNKKTPLAKKFAASEPDLARRTFHEIALEMAERDGEVPTRRAVVKEYETRRRRELKALGVDIPTVAKTKKTTKTKTRDASETEVAKKKTTKEPPEEHLSERELLLRGIAELQD